ncbi:hypothetical protein C7T35_10390 [Variovorax sp. WS11]|nr:hypothetical protein C7T35_10390 [Variovorax sp. WS11]
MDDPSLRPRDAGLQAERTALAWSRTGLAIWVNALVALRAGWANGRAPITALAFALLIAAGVAIAYGVRRRRRLLDGRSPCPPSALATAMVAILTMVACATAIASIFLR